MLSSLAQQLCYSKQDYRSPATARVQFQQIGLAHSWCFDTKDDPGIVVDEGREGHTKRVVLEGTVSQREVVLMEFVWLLLCGAAVNSLHVLLPMINARGFDGCS